jgi:hypothetical protein
MSDQKLRAWWFHRQGLDGSLEGARADEVLTRAGWARSVGGVGPYLTLWSRAGIGREAADRAVSQLEIHELPAARGCTYVVPGPDFALALTVGRPFGQAELNTAYKLGVTPAELDRLREAVLRALAKGPLDPDGIRDAVGPAARSLGEAGKKKGLSTTLPLALGTLQSTGEIRRIPVNGRLDQQRYRYTLWRPNPIGRTGPTDPDSMVDLARRYFSWVGPATPAEFQWFSGLGVKAAKEATAPLGLVPAEPGADRLLLPDDATDYRKFTPPAKPRYALVGSLDSIQAHRRGMDGILDPADAKRKVPIEKGEQPAGELADLPAHAILDRGRLIGLWEYDPEAESIVFATFGIKDKALDQMIERTEAFVRDDLGDARSFSLDSPKSRLPKLAALRKMKR